MGSVYYELAARTGRPAELRDAGGRLALEAFGSLRIDELTASLEAYRQSLVGIPDAKWDFGEAARSIQGYVDFVRTFGPLGVRWASEFVVRNPTADRLKRELDRAQWQLRGADPDTVVRHTAEGLGTFWTVSFWGHGPGRGAVPDVRKHRYWHGPAWLERIRRGDDGLRQDSWHLIVDEYKDLWKALDMAEAITQGDPIACKRAVRALYQSDEVEFSTEAADWALRGLGAAVTTARPASGVLKLFKLPLTNVDWQMVARISLSDLIGRQIDFAMPTVGLDQRDQFVVAWRGSSLLETIYLQLLEHVRAHPGRGVARCGNCGGPILRTKRPGVTGNQWHRGCQGGRVQRWRASGAKGGPRTRRA